MSLWDTFRVENPLLTLTQPARVNDFVNTMLEHCKIFGTLPVWPEGGKETWCMIGNHAIPVITEAYLKGFRNYDANEALTDMTLGKEDVAEKYAKRSQNWENVFDPPTGFMRGKTADGSWVTPFGKKEMNSISFDEYTEANAWQYNFFVLHDVPGLIGKLGGDEKFVARLDEMFDTKETIPNLAMISDVTGVIGMYSHGNEPDHQVAYLYDYAGQPWKSQAHVRQIASTLCSNTSGGICGNDDCGQISAWYVFSALGFYPVDPASGNYILGSPFFDKVTLKLDPVFANGHFSTVIANNNSAKNPYIQSATLNGKPLTRSWISHDEITAGGKLVLTMGPTPNKYFGSALQDRPMGM
jgi:predicted alpha-1,2-mannosidase